MTKRRRERDRPKASHDAPYDPNKRVMLTYSSDSSPDEAPSARPTDDAHLANYEIAPYPEDEGEDNEEYEPQAPQMQQRESPSYEMPEKTETDDVEPKTKGRGKGKAGIKKDLETNQWPALGSVLSQLGDGDGDAEQEEYDSTTEEAMAYLKSVRAERQAIPAILTEIPYHDEDEEDGTNAEVRQDDEDGEETYHENDEVSALPSTNNESAPDPTDDATDPQKVFNRKLVERFLCERQRFLLPIPAEKLAALDADHPISFPQHNNQATLQWLRILSNTPPVPAQVCALDVDTVYELLGLLKTRVLKKATDVNVITSTWIWSLLLKLQDVGNMTNDEVYPLRQFGKMAIYLLFSFTNPGVAAQLKKLEEGEDPEEPSAPSTDEISLDEDLAVLDDDFSEPITTDAAQDLPTIPSCDTSTILYTIITIIGEVFGQRDLLEFRPVWLPDATAA